jgi:hypothetical protein
MSQVTAVTGSRRLVPGPRDLAPGPRNDRKVRTECPPKVAPRTDLMFGLRKQAVVARRDTLLKVTAEVRSMTAVLLGRHQRKSLSS